MSTSGEGSGGFESLIRAIVREALRDALPEVAQAVASELQRVAPRNDALLDVSDAAEVAGVKPGTIRTWACSGRVRVAGSGRPYKFRRADLEADVAQIKAARRGPSRVRAAEDLDADEWARRQAEKKKAGGA